MLIFIIDDEKSVREELEETVGKAVNDAEIKTFSRGKYALDALEEGLRPNVVFSDIEMPGISGIELAVKIKNISLSSRIVFITGYEEYAIDAFKIKAHGYLLKPVSVDDIKHEMEYVPQETGDTQDKLVVKCFGYFDVFYQGKPLLFARNKSKELFAYLIDREGATVTNGDVALVLWQEGADKDAEHNRLRVLVNDIRSTLRSIGMEEVLIRRHRQTAINRELIDCDYYRLLEGDIDAINAYKGEYMIDYSWAEMKNAYIEERLG